MAESDIDNCACNMKRYVYNCRQYSQGLPLENKYKTNGRKAMGSLFALRDGEIRAKYGVRAAVGGGRSLAVRKQ